MGLLHDELVHLSFSFLGAGRPLFFPICLIPQSFSDNCSHTSRVISSVFSELGALCLVILFHATHKVLLPLQGTALEPENKQPLGPVLQLHPEFADMC